MTKHITFGSLFRGIGGFDLGFENAGMSLEWSVEIDEDCNAVARRHWPKVPQFGDVRECHSKEYLDKWHKAHKAIRKEALIVSCLT